jgi:hypothetical protein
MSGPSAEVAIVGVRQTNFSALYASMLIQRPAHRVTGDEWAAVVKAGVQPMAPGDRELFVRIVPSRITGRRISPA